MKQAAAVIIAVSPIVAGTAIKGPAAKIMRETGIDPSAAAVAAHYRNIVDGFVFDQSDADLAARIASLDMTPCAAQTLMRSMEDRIGLAAACLDFAGRLLSQHS